MYRKKIYKTFENVQQKHIKYLCTYYEAVAEWAEEYMTLSQTFL